MSKRNSSSNSVGVLGLLGIVFVTLKLTGYIDWSWWWVTIPFWGGAALVIVLTVLLMLFLVWKDRTSKLKKIKRGRNA